MKLYSFCKDISDKNTYYQTIENINYENYLFDMKEDFENPFFLSENGANESNTPSVNQAAINALIEKVSSLGGGTVVVDGNFKTGTVQLKDDVTLYIKRNCSLIAPNYDESKIHNVIGKAFINAEYAKNICIFGPGKIVGNGTSYTMEADDDSPLPPLEYFNVKQRVVLARKRLRKGIEGSNRLFHMLRFYHCDTVNVDRLHVSDGSFWTCLVEESKNAVITNTVLDNNVHVANCDGIDIVNSQSVKVDHCFIATADDGLCIKSNAGGCVKDIMLTNNVVISMANPFKIGTETGGNIFDVSLKDCFFTLPEVVGGYAGISIESADGAEVHDITVENVVMKSVSSALLIWLGDRLRKGGSDGKTVGKVYDITVKNVKAEDVELPMAITGCIHAGITYSVKNVLLQNIDVKYRDTKEKLDLGKADYEESANDYPEITRVLHRYQNSHEESVYFDMPVYGLFARHADGLILDNVNVTPRSVSTLPKDNVIIPESRYDVKNVTVIRRDDVRGSGTEYARANGVCKGRY